MDCQSLPVDKSRRKRIREAATVRALLPALPPGDGEALTVRERTDLPPVSNQGWTKEPFSQAQYGCDTRGPTAPTPAEPKVSSEPHQLGGRQAFDSSPLQPPAPPKRRKEDERVL